MCFLFWWMTPVFIQHGTSYPRRPALSAFSRASTRPRGGDPGDAGHLPFFPTIRAELRGLRSPCTTGDSPDRGRCSAIRGTPLNIFLFPCSCAACRFPTSWRCRRSARDRYAPGPRYSYSERKLRARDVLAAALSCRRDPDAPADRRNQMIELKTYRLPMQGKSRASEA